MSLQLQLNKQALDSLKATSRYIDTVSKNNWDHPISGIRERAGHHRAVILQKINNNSIPISNMTLPELHNFDIECEKILIDLDSYSIVPAN